MSAVNSLVCALNDTLKPLTTKHIKTTTNRHPNHQSTHPNQTHPNTTKQNTTNQTQDIFSKVDKSGEGVCVQASTLGSLEALLAFLDSDDVQIPVSGINIGPVHKKDVLRANVMAEKGFKKVRACVRACVQ